MTANTRHLAVLIMAAGKGTRMKRDDIPKVCNLVLGKPLIQYVVDQAKSISATRIICIVGHQQEKVREVLQDEPVEFAEQLEQLGTGHAVQQAAPLLKDFQGDVIVLSGDVPLLQGSTLKALLNKHQREHYAATVLTALADDPFGYGRVIRTDADLFDYVVEQKDASEEELKTHEINSGIYVFDGELLFENLFKINNSNAQGEYYLTEVLTIIKGLGKKVGVEICETFSEIQGINTVDELKTVERKILASKEDR
ncbi:MAG: NTP transferase domain-containing protein [Candidatus Marinimicrobia bacterium]|nr:NTP transferase domain-containing protein [Candidatus Neomarinimicrobiota bacterium]MCF7851456.1 NTP transferase domain-containing protein [Candidatus Neomarinimicrobiota bacterium]MCF7904103.1 NTP transferase domain-containing protein [Candidatus Neomarinimicrobiota bacterium]